MFNHLKKHETMALLEVTCGLLDEVEQLQREVKKLNKKIFVNNYFHGCPCDPYTVNSLERKAAKKFQKLNDYGTVVTHYTDKNSYAGHIGLIKEWEAEVKKSLKKK